MKDTRLAGVCKRWTGTTGLDYNSPLKTNLTTKIHFLPLTEDAIALLWLTIVKRPLLVSCPSFLSREGDPYSWASQIGPK